MEAFRDKFVALLFASEPSLLECLLFFTGGLNKFFVGDVAKYRLSNENFQESLGQSHSNLCHVKLLHT